MKQLLLEEKELQIEMTELLQEAEKKVELLQETEQEQLSMIQRLQEKREQLEALSIPTIRVITERKSDISGQIHWIWLEISLFLSEMTTH